MKKQTEDTNKKNHKGNFKISVSFDLFGKCSDKIAINYVRQLEADMKRLFKDFQKLLSRQTPYEVLNALQVKNIKWNE